MFLFLDFININIIYMHSPEAYQLLPYVGGAGWPGEPAAPPCAGPGPRRAASIQ